jgi:hypothetical protein
MERALREDELNKNEKSTRAVSKFTLQPTSFTGLQCEDEARHEEALVWAGHVLPQKWQYLTATHQGVARYSLMKYTSLRKK